MSSPNPACTAYEAHDHQHCIDTALSTARQLCIKKGLKLTSMREQVFSSILQSHQPQGAYTILATLNQASDPQNTLAAQTIYRALNFLVELQLIHRIASLNAYIACCRPARRHQPQFLICQNCQTVQELDQPAINNAILSRATNFNFTVLNCGVEVFGLCVNCQPPSTQTEQLT